MSNFCPEDEEGRFPRNVCIDLLNYGGTRGDKNLETYANFEYQIDICLIRNIVKHLC
jgi:hypothetical protein